VRGKVMNGLNKQIEGIRWQYLMRSATYKDFCIKQRKQNTIHREHVNFKDEKSGKLKKYYYEPFTENPIEAIFLKYGDVHVRTFEDYWKEKEKWDRRTDIIFFEPVMDYTKMITYDLEDIIYWYEEANGRKPSVNEIKKFFPIHLKQKSNAIYLEILQKDFSYDEVKKIIRQVEVLLKNRIPLKRFHKEELERYLKVYDSRNQKPPITYKKIQEKLYPQIAFTENMKRSRINDFKKAKEIIANVESNKLFYW
jgi:hypothetical protein